jgi:hypothetical protein
MPAVLLYCVDEEYDDMPALVDDHEDNNLPARIDSYIAFLEKNLVHFDFDLSNDSFYRPMTQQIHIPSFNCHCFQVKYIRCASLCLRLY